MDLQKVLPVQDWRGRNKAQSSPVAVSNVERALPWSIGGNKRSYVNLAKR